MVNLKYKPQKDNVVKMTLNVRVVGNCTCIEYPKIIVNCLTCRAVSLIAM